MIENIEEQKKFKRTSFNPKTEIIPVGFDTVFKKIFGSGDNNKYIRYLLKKILKIEPQNIKILNSEMIGDRYKEKDTTVDFIVELEDGDKIGIELNSVLSNYVITRNFFYMARIMSGELMSGESYLDLKKHIQINFDFEGSHTRPIEIYKMIEEETKVVLTDRLTVIRIDIPYFKDLCYHDVEDLDELSKLIALIGTKEKKTLNKIVKGDKIMEEIYEKAKEFSKDEKIIGEYNLEEYRKNMMIAEREEGMAHGLEQGRLEGKLEGIKITAKNLIKLNVDINSISKATGLSIEEINELK